MALGSTYLELCNRVIRRINEVELTDTSFPSARGIQAVVKDCVKDSIAEINQQKWEWPYHAYENSQQLEVGESEYAWPSDFKAVDWSTFQIRKDGVYATNNQVLQLIDRNEWYRLQRDFDDDNVPLGSQIPRYVFKAHGNGFGVSPNPDQPYTLEFRYYINEPILVNFDDRTNIPPQYDNVITAGAMYHMNLFRENAQGVTIAQNNFTAGIKNMYENLVGSTGNYMYSTVINDGGSPWTKSDNYHL